jgi:Tfp pilus assembly protein PilE
MIRMVPILVILTIIGCIVIKSLTQRVRRTHNAEVISMRRVKWGLTEEAFLKS